MAVEQIKDTYTIQEHKVNKLKLAIWNGNKKL